MLGNTTVQDNGDQLLGASHLYSGDGGKCWKRSDGKDHTMGSCVSHLPLIHDANPDRVESLAHQEEHHGPGPTNLNYLQIILSNGIATEDGGFHVMVHNGLKGEVDWMKRDPNGEWTVTLITDIARGGEEGLRVHMQSSLALLPNGNLRCVLMLETTQECVWGPPGTFMVGVELPLDDSTPSRLNLTTPDTTRAQWLPAQPSVGGAPPEGWPALLYTRGLNAGGFDQNVNEVETEVRLLTFEDPQNP